MQRSLWMLAIAIVGAVVILNGCSKRIKPEPVEEKVEVLEEEVASPPEVSEPVAETEQLEIRELEMAIVEETLQEPTDKDDRALLRGNLAHVYFDFDKFNIREDMRPILEANAKWLKSNPKLTIAVEGHADERGTNEYNLALGERRAQAVKRFYVALGVGASRLSTISYGEERLVCMQRHEACFSKNRRAQFDIQK